MQINFSGDFPEWLAKDNRQETNNLYTSIRGVKFQKMKITLQAAGN